MISINNNVAEKVMSKPVIITLLVVNANLFVVVHELKLHGKHKVSATVCTELNLPSLDVEDSIKSYIL